MTDERLRAQDRGEIHALVNEFLACAQCDAVLVADFNVCVRHCIDGRFFCLCATCYADIEARRQCVADGDDDRRAGRSHICEKGRGPEFRVYDEPMTHADVWLDKYRLRRQR